MRLMFRFAVLIAAATAVLEMPATAQLALNGTYDVTLSAGDVKIPAAAQIPPEGVYHVKLEGDTLTFTKVTDDECPGRVAAMTPKPFTAVR